MVMVIFLLLFKLSLLPPQATEGLLDFLPGERLKFITVTIVDNPVPELDKSFRVELFNPEGGGRNRVGPGKDLSRSHYTINLPIGSIDY